MNLHDANRVLDATFGGEDESPIRFIERRRTCRSCGQPHDLPIYREEVDETTIGAYIDEADHSTFAFAVALFVCVVMFAAVFVGMAVAS